MNRLRVLVPMVKADFLERVRRTSFLFTLGIAVFLAYTVFRGQMTLRLGDYRGVYNSAWIGAVLVAVSDTMLMLAGFYVVKNTLERDRDTRVGEILASTRMTRMEYVFGKAISNFAVLVLMLVVLAGCALLMQFFQAEEPGVHLWALFSPFVYLALPLMALVASLAVLFEVLPILRGSLGNTVYFGVWIGAMLTSFMTRVDCLGVGILMESLSRACKAKYPGYDHSFTLGGGFEKTPLRLFHWDGIQWTPELLLQRLQWLGIAVGVTLISAFFFDRFDTSRAAAKEGPPEEDREAPAEETGGGREAREAPPAHVSTWVPAGLRFRFGDLVAVEVRLMLKGLPRWWYLVVLALVPAGLLLPPAVGSRSAGLASWILLLPVWSSLGARECRHDTRQMVFACAHPLARQLPATWVAGFLVTLAAGSGIALRLAVAGQGAHLAAWIVGAAFIPSLALFLGALSGGTRLFEVLYLLWWYIGPVNKVAAMDFMGAWPDSWTTAVPAVYALLTLALLALAVPARRRQIYV